MPNHNLQDLEALFKVQFERGVVHRDKEYLLAGRRTLRQIVIQKFKPNLYEIVRNLFNLGYRGADLRLLPSDLIE